jgi:hypothetical protein
MDTRHPALHAAIAALLGLLPSHALFAQSVLGPDRFLDDFSAAAPNLWRAAPGVQWRIEDGCLRSPVGSGVETMLRAPLIARDVRVAVDLRLPTEGRRNPGVLFRFRDDGTGWIVRWYDRQQWLELLRYERGGVVRVEGNHWQASTPANSAPQRPGAWYTLEVAAIGQRVRARVWPRGQSALPWQLDARCPDLGPGAVGVSADESAVCFDNFVALTGDEIADLVREEERAAEMQRQRRKSIVLSRRDVGPYPRCLASFRAGSPPTAEVVFLAHDKDSYYFARALPDRLALGRVIDGSQTILAEARCDWWSGPGEYVIEADVHIASRDQRGPAWFLNADRVPPMLRLSARVRRPEEGASRRWAVSAIDDPVIPGKRGEPYWHPDPFASSSARYPFGPHCGWREAPGVQWVGLDCSSRPPKPQTCPVLQPCLRIDTGDRGGCWLALGDVDGDGRLDYVVARNDNQAVTALTGYGNDGRELWRWGEGGKADIAYDVPATVYDLDGDGHAEVLCSIRGFILALDGRTGIEKARFPLPKGLDVADCIMVANLRGRPRPSDVLIKSRYDHLWACDDRLNVLWEWRGNTGHHPAVRDIDGDGRDEVLCGYALLDHDGTVLWELPLPDHADTARLVEMEPGGPVRAVIGCGGGNEMVVASLSGEILHHPQPPLTDFHFQTINVGDIRATPRGYEMVVDDGWARPGRAQLALFDSRARWLGAHYSAYQRFARLVEWGELARIVLPADGVIVDGRGKLLARFVDPPTFGGPGAESPMARTADVNGDGEDEVILYNAEQIVVYANPHPPTDPLPPQPTTQERLYNFTYY